MREIQGLTTAEVQERLKNGQNNVRVDPSTRTVKQIIKDNVFTYFNLIFVILAVMLVIAGSGTSQISFMLIAIANTCIGIFQEIRSKKTLDSMRFLHMKKSRVIRSGRETEVPTEQLVIDDVVILRSGNQIPADAEILDGEVQVNEALLTGESDEITKREGDKLLSGSFIISGECAAKLTAVGRDSYISRLTIEATKEKSYEQSEMIRSLDRLVRVIGVIIIPVGALLLYQELHVLHDSFSSAVTSMVAAVIGMIPEGLYMTASIAMVVSTVKLAYKKVLVQNMKCIESLARVDVLCVDKTGTITEPTMRVEGMTVLLENTPSSEVESLIADVVGCQAPDNATMEALQDRFANGSGREPLSVLGFSSKYKYSGVSFASGIFVIGAPEYVLADDYGRYADFIDDYAAKGFRVLALAGTEQMPDGGVIAGRVVPIALIFLINPVRENAKETFRYFAENGVDIKVLSGDNPATVSMAAVAAGIPGGDHYVDARELTNERAIYDAVQRFTVFGRVTPEQKLLFVKALKKLGKTVGMTGDGVNDVLALRDADCSVAMASGSEAASNASQLVLMDSDFGRMPDVVREGRQVVNNIQKTASLYLTKNIFSILLAIFSVINVVAYPLKPSQITLISMFTIGMPSLVLSLEPNTDKIKGRFLGNVFRMAAPAGVTMFITVSALVIFGKVFNIDSECISTSSAMLVALVGFLFLGKVSQPPNKVHVTMIAALIAGMMLCVILAPEVFGISAITLEAAMLLALFLVATEGLFRYIDKLVTKFFRFKDGRKAAKAKKRAEKRARRAR